MKTPCVLVCAFSIFLFSARGHAQERAGEARAAAEAKPLESVQVVSSDGLRSVTSVAISPDGRFLYGAAFNPGNISIFQRLPATGELVLNHQVGGPNLQAAVSIRLSQDARRAVVSAFRANAITLYGRDPETGALTELDSAREGENGNQGLNFVIAGSFSQDGRFIYTASRSGIGIFKVAEDKLSFVQLETADQRFNGLRDVQFSPDGMTLYAASTLSNSLAVLRRDGDTGKLQLIQWLNHEEDRIDGLAGVFRVACSPDGRHVYTNSGRFGGVNAVTVFAVSADGKLERIEEHVAGMNGMDGFVGGNGIQVSADGRMVFAVASISDSLVRFARDAETGKLTFLGAQSVDPQGAPGSAHVAVSPDGKFIYVADEASHSVVVFKTAIPGPSEPD